MVGIKGIGKVFELALTQSAPNYALMYRLIDPAGSFGGGGKLRFSLKNPFDFLLWDSKRHILYALEAKTVSGKSISFERDKDDKGEIHHHQISNLNRWDKYDGITCGLIIEFRELEKTIFLEIKDMNKVINSITKKSFTIKDLDENNIPYFTIPQKKKKARYTYDLDCFLAR